MKIIHATWEKRNLGRDAWEITFESEDEKNSQIVNDFLDNPIYNDSYLCAKVPAGQINVIHALENAGFRFMENQIGIYFNFKKQRLPESLQKFSSYLSCEEVPAQDIQWDEVNRNITDDMFISDRIYLDPIFPNGTSSMRYKNWINDMKSNLSNTLLIWRIAKTGELIGFDIMKSIIPTSIAILGGVFPGKAFVGLIHVYCLFNMLYKKGASEFKTFISSNNLPMLRCYAELGAVANNIIYVLRKTK